MTRNEDTTTDPAIRRLVGELIDRSAPSPTWSEVVERPLATPSRPRRRWIAPALVAACVIVLIVGLIAVVDRPSETRPAEQPSVSSLSTPTSVTSPAVPAVPGVIPIALTTASDPVALSDVADVARSEWIVPTLIADGFDFRYAAWSGGNQDIQFGDGAPPSAREIRIVVFSQWFHDPGREIRIVDVGGTTWNVSNDEVGWTASRAIGPVHVVVMGAGLNDSTGLAIVESLVVVDEDTLIDPPLEDFGGPAVARGPTGDGEATLFASATNDWFCTSHRTATGSGGGCAQYFDRANIVDSIDGGYSHPEGSSEIEVINAGVAIPTVERVEVEFIDGTVVEATPTDLSGSFDVEFWIVGATITLDDPDQVWTIVSTVTEIRAFDADGIQIATTR